MLSRFFRRAKLLVVTCGPLAACVQEHVESYVGGALPATQTAVIQSGDNRKNDDCASYVHGMVTQLDGKEIEDNVSIDATPGTRTPVVTYEHPAPYVGWSEEKRFIVDLEAGHTYKVYVRWTSCPLIFPIDLSDFKDLETGIYDVSTGIIVSHEVAAP